MLIKLYDNFTSEINYYLRVNLEVDVKKYKYTAKPIRHLYLYLIASDRMEIH